MRLRPAVMCLLSFSMLWPAPALVPVAVAQEAQGSSLAEPAVIDTVPPDAIVLSQKECIEKALADNIGIAVRRFDPQVSDAFVGVEESVLNPLLTGSAYKSSDQQKRISSFIGPYSSSVRLNAYSAQWYDPLSIGGSYQFNVDVSDDKSETANQLGANSSTGYNTDWKFTYNLPLLRHLGRQVNTSSIVVAQNSLGISESQFRQTVLDTVASAVKAYADLNYAILQLGTSRFSLKLAQDFLAQNRIKVRVGTLAPIEITQAEAQVADREESVIIFEAAVRAAEDNIRRVIGMRKDSPDWARPVRPSDPLYLEEFEPSEETALTAALSHRPDLEQARLDLLSRETTLRADKNLRRWGLDFQGAYGNLGFDDSSYSQSYSDLKDRNQTNWSLGLALSVPIGNRLAISNYQAAESSLAQSQFRLAQVEQEARLEVRSAVRAVETNMKRVKASEVNVRLQHEKLDAEQKKFENGMSTSFQVLQFQDDLSNAEARENLAKADYNKSLAELERVKGTLLERFNIDVQSPVKDRGRRGGIPSADLSDTIRDPGLRVAERTGEGIHLPTDFTFQSGQAVPASGSR